MPTLTSYLLGRLTPEAALAAQRRLAFDVAGGSPAGVVLLFEPASHVSIGREGSMAHVRLSLEELASREWPVLGQPRGGGTMLHLPGQVMAWPILPLARLSHSPAGYVDALHHVALELLEGFGLKGKRAGTGVKVNGRRILHVGAAIRGGITAFGLTVNATPDLDLFHGVDCDGDSMPMTSLQRECPTRVRLATVRERLLSAVATRFGFARTSVFHEWAIPTPTPTRHAVVAPAH